MQVEKIEFKKILVLFSLIFILCLGFVVPTIRNFKTYASSTDPYSNVLYDLQKDENFNVSDYPTIKDDYSVKVIQIAESTGKELLIYIYQPSAEFKELKFTTISISTIIDNENADFNLYNLTFLNSDGVFLKFKVEDLEVKDDIMRRYNISEIHRQFDKGIDKELDNGNLVTEVPYRVAQDWTVTTVDDKTYYKLNEIEVVEITDKYVGFVRYNGSSAPSWLAPLDAMDSHFVAFSCDYEIDKLLSADIVYRSQSWKKYSDTKSLFGAISDPPIKTTLKYDDIVSSEGSGLFFKKAYSWNRIQKPNDFFSSVESSSIFECGVFNVATETKLTEQSKSNIENKQWVLRFTETEYDATYHRLSHGGGYYTYQSTIVRDVTILRLEFEIDGKVYNLGVIDNKQTSSNVPDNITITSTEITDLFKAVLIVIGALLLLILLIILSPILRPIFTVIGDILLSILKVVGWVVTSPFELFKTNKKG